MERRPHSVGFHLRKMFRIETYRRLTVDQGWGATADSPLGSYWGDKMYNWIVLVVTQLLNI